jgi:type 1 glutamine amidotransferase
VEYSRLILIGAMAALTACAAPPKKVLFIGATAGWQHDSISYATGTIWKLGVETKLWETYIKTDTQLITKQPIRPFGRNLKFFDAVVFFTSGELPMNDEQKAALLSFVQEDGKGFLAIHSGVDTFYKWPEYGEMVGGYFDDHPWLTFDAPMVVEDPAFPGMQDLPRAFTMQDEIYQIRDFSRDKVRVLMSLDASKLDMTRKNIHRTDNDFAVIWARNYGKGRVLYNGLGHLNEVYDRPDVQKMMVEHMKWILGLVPGDATPRPKTQKAEKAQ